MQKMNEPTRRALAMCRGTQALAMTLSRGRDEQWPDVQPTTVVAPVPMPALTPWPTREPLRGPGVGDAIRVEPGAFGVERRVARRARARRRWWASLVRTNVTLRPRARRRASTDMSRRGKRAVHLERGARSPPRRRRSRRGRDRSAGAPPIMRAERCPIMRTRGILHRGHDALGLRGAVELEVVVDRGEAPSRTPCGTRGRSRARRRADVELDAVEQRERVAELGLHRADLRALLEQRLAADARQRALGVIGDGEHAVARAPWRPRRPPRATSARRPRPWCGRGSRR